MKRKITMIEKCEKCNSTLIISNSENKIKLECSYCGLEAGDGVILEYNNEETE